jgi:hypothetical protein
MKGKGTRVAEMTSRKPPIQVVLGHRVELGAVEHAHLVRADTDAAGDRGRGQPVVAGDHVDPDTRPVHLPDRGLCRTR